MHTSVQIMIVAMIWFKELEICILHGIQLKLVCYGVNSGLSDHHHVLAVASRSLPKGGSVVGHIFLAVVPEGGG